jgi:hypothetical protein
MSIKIKIKKVTIQEEAGYIERRGEKKATTFQAKVCEWVDPDDTDNQPTQ